MKLVDIDTVNPSDLFSGLGVKAHEFFRFGEFAGWIIAK